MKKLIAALLFSLPLAGSYAIAADDVKPAQQGKMSMCNKDAGDKKGDERKALMKECLKKEGVPDKVADKVVDKRAAQQEKMRACNKDAVGQKGDERKAFMKACLGK